MNELDGIPGRGTGGSQCKGHMFLSQTFGDRKERKNSRVIQENNEHTFSHDAKLHYIHLSCTLLDTHTHTYIYIYIEREREREREKEWDLTTVVYILYIYIERERKKERKNGILPQ